MSYHVSDFTTEQRQANAVRTQAFAQALANAGLPLEVMPVKVNYDDWKIPADFRVQVTKHRTVYVRVEHESEYPEEGRINLVCKDSRVKTGMRNANRNAYDFEVFVHLLETWGLDRSIAAKLFA
jgi:hypothetical protein